MDIVRGRSKVGGREEGRKKEDGYCKGKEGRMEGVREGGRERGRERESVRERERKREREGGGGG